MIIPDSDLKDLMKRHPRSLKTRTIRTDLGYDFDEKDLSVVIKELTDLHDNFIGDYSSLFFEHEEHYNGCELNLKGENKETDEEYLSRLKKIYYSELKIKEKKYKTYLKLKEEFDGTL